MAILIKKLKKLSLADLVAGTAYIEDHSDIDDIKSQEFIKVAHQEIKERVYDLFEETAKTDF